MTERDKILGRIREALQVPATRPGHDQRFTTAVSGEHHGPAPSPRPWLPFAPTAPHEKEALFQAKALELRADFKLLHSEAELQQALLTLRDSQKWTRVGAGTGELVELAVSALSLPVCRTAGGYQVSDLESCSVGITECDALVAQTGSVLLTSVSGAGRALSVLPPHHLVLARRAQLLSDLPEAFAFLKSKYGGSYPSFISLITGPSRTGDIERVLVLGAHGPKQLTILCL